MPATMMHLLAGHALKPDGSDSFFLGCILPDCLDADRAKKDHLHLRDLPPEKRLQGLVRFGKEMDLTRDFDFGVLYHMYLDYLWDNGPQKVHRMNYKGDLWFRDYRKELAKAGSRSAQRMPWSTPLWERLHAAPAEAWKNSLGLPEEDVHNFLNFNHHWHTTEALPESEVFTDEVVDAFILRSEKAFRRFLRDFFPKVAEMRLGA